MDDWRSPIHRQNVVDKINESMANGGIVARNATDLENQLFQKAHSQEEYRSMVTKIIMHMQQSSQKNKNKQSEPMDPINALQNLASQGTRQGPMPTQMMGMGNSMGVVNPNANANVLQNLIHQQRPGQPAMQGMQGVRVNQQAMPNAIQQGNIPPGAINANNMNMNMAGGIGGANAAGQMPNAMAGQINQMQMREMNVHGGQINPINNMNMQMNINSSLPQNQINPNNLNPQMAAGQQMNPNQMSQMLNRMNPTAMNQAAQNVGNQMNPAQMLNQINAGQGANIPVSQPQINAAMISNANMPANINQPNVTASPMQAGGQMNLNPMINMQHMPRGQPTNVMFQGIRNTTPNQPYFRKSPSPSAPSPMGGSLPNQMVPSPALVPSPQVTNIMSQRNVVMAPSPSNTNLNTPGQTAAAPSPLNQNEEHLYREKYRQLTKYIDPLKKMIARIDSDDEKLCKMKKLLEILCNPNQRIPLETLIKCEMALEKMDLKTYSIASTTTPYSGGSKEHHMNNALMDAVSANLQSPIGNHTLQRTFRPCIESLFGPDIKNLPAKQPRLPTSSDSSRLTSAGVEIPHLLQGEIARLDQKFKVSVDPSIQAGSKAIKLICTLDDIHLPCVPPIYVTIPDDYPLTSPSCNLLEHEVNATPFLNTCQKTLVARMSKMPTLFSLSHLLDTWEMAIRQACSPNNIANAPTQAGILLGV